MPARRPAALVGAAAVLAAGVLAAAAPAHASEGTASATTARVGLHLNLLNKADVPVNLTLNEVRAPRTSEKTLLTAKIDDVAKGQPVELVRADVAKSKAVTEGKKAEGYANLVHVKVNVPGLPTKPVFEAKQVTSKATCVQGQQPTADSEVLGQVTVLGKRVSLSAKGTTTVDAPGVGQVKLALSDTATTSDSAAGTALKLNVEVKPAQLNVGSVKGEIVLIEAKCQMPGGDGATASGGQTGGAADSGADSAGAADSGATAGSETEGAGNDPATQTGDEGKNLAETGGGGTIALGGVGAALLIGGGALVYMRRRKNSAQG